MNRIVVEGRVGDDGVLHLDLPMGATEAGRAVRVTVEPVTPKPVLPQEEWQRQVLAMAGSITDPTFERPPQGELEEREPLP